MTNQTTPSIPLNGDMRITYIHQVGSSTPVSVPVKNEMDAVSKINFIADTMLALYADRSIPDYSNVIFVEVYEVSDSNVREGEWVEWDSSEAGGWYEDIKAMVDEGTSGDWYLTRGRFIHTPKAYDIEIVDAQHNIGVIRAGYPREACNNPLVDFETVTGFRKFAPPFVE